MVDVKKQTKNLKGCFCLGKVGVNFGKWKLATTDYYKYSRMGKTPFIIRNKRDISDKLATLKYVNEMNLKNKLYNKNAYHWGLVNGIIYSIAILEGVPADKVKYIESNVSAKLSKIVKPKSGIILPK